MRALKAEGCPSISWCRQERGVFATSPSLPQVAAMGRTLAMQSLLSGRVSGGPLRGTSHQQYNSHSVERTADSPGSQAGWGFDAKAAGGGKQWCECVGCAETAHRTPFPLSRFRDHTEELETDWGVCFPTAGTAEVKAGRMSWRGGGAWMWHEARACLARAYLRACFCSSGT